MKLLIIFAAILSLFCRCQAKPEPPSEGQYKTTDIIFPSPPHRPKNQEEQSEMVASSPRYDAETYKVELAEPSLFPAKVIRHAYLRLQVKDYAASTKALNNYIAHWKAFISNAEEDRASGTLENSLTIRVTDDNFEPLVQDLLKESDYLEQKTITSKDVTEEWLDNDTRLNSRKKVEERYLALLARAKNVKEILAIESELRTIQEEIDAAAAKQQYLQNQVAFSTITLDYFQTTSPTISPDNSLTKRILQALIAGWDGTVAALILLIQLWPIALLITLLVTLYLKFKKSRFSVINTPHL
ncbi:DUF4349 domain-containing protein [Adhaeribacter rhizoryzae]|uniref:DUF4349 domain-containing protein n=1 Tax=Adhaeribacter rhizoryzae TaxID=2607907 RepID=A0A5M6DPQ2_9BACT|nr:DUF4349 domain-containing protein [Adhaeribacter rhizoryzae]KAA5548170.1 DUF4349 domain-containing protein [Adhaeribacter rhizoryzae]